MTEREAPPIDEIVDEKPRLDETGMASMPLDSVLKFEPEDRRMMDMLLKAADERLASEYAQLFEIEAQFISKVRQRLPVAAGGGYARNANGSFVEMLTASAHTALRIAADAAFAGRIERVSLRRLA